VVIQPADAANLALVTKPRLTQTEHIELGRALAGVHDELVHRKVQLRNAYPQTGPEAEPAREIEKALGALRKARSALENLAFREHPDTAATTDYYPHPEDRAVVEQRPGDAYPSPA
jgi:hypothetical protein